MHFAPRAPRRVSSVVATVVIALAATGCGAAGPPSQGSVQPGPPASGAPRPAVQAGVTLVELGFAHGPREFALPEEVQLTRRVDQPNVVTLVLSGPAGPELARWVRGQAYAGGWRVIADANDAVVFDNDTWLAAFTGGDPSGLTFRRRSQ